MSNFEMFQNLTSLKKLTATDLFDFFQQTLNFKQSIQSKGWSQFRSPEKKLILQIFFESSTRTRVSFEMASHRLGLDFLHYQMDSSTSMSKGETVKDSLKVFEALSPDLIIYRCGSDLDVLDFFNQSKVPSICAGWGEKYHPTQALLDMFSLYEIYGNDISKLNIVFVGDTKASRVFGSHLELSKILGYKISQCSDSDHSVTGVNNYVTLDEALSSNEVVIRLRTQKERGSKLSGDKFKITKKQIESNDFMLMHPGPFLREEDFDADLPEHKKSLIWKQKENGLYIRAMIFKKIWSF